MANLLHVFKSFLFCLRGKGNDNLAFIQEPFHFFCSWLFVKWVITFINFLFRRSKCLFRVVKVPLWLQVEKSLKQGWGWLL